MPCQPQFHIATWLNHIDRMILEMKSMDFQRWSNLLLEMKQLCLSVIPCHSFNVAVDLASIAFFAIHNCKQPKEVILIAALS
jgi:hypothetical protein